MLTFTMERKNQWYGDIYDALNGAREWLEELRETGAISEQIQELLSRIGPPLDSYNLT